MRLDLGPESTWPSDVVITVEPLAERPFDEAAWRAHVLARLLPGGAATPVEGTTLDGAAMALAEGDRCLVALYAFVDHVGVASARAADAATLATRRAELVTFLRGARPDWDGPEVVALVDLWEE